VTTVPGAEGFVCPLIRLRWAVVIFAAVWAVYLGGLHPWFMNWGATPAEQKMVLPGDDLLPDVSSRFTRGITIRAPASVVWQWVVQIGQDRAGFYSNTWLENLTGADIHNADAIHAEWQRRAIGDRVLLARPDLFRGFFAQVAQTSIVALEPERLIANIPGRFVFQSIDRDTTRLLLRESIPSGFAARAINALMWDPMHFVMQQRMLRGIKERAEGRPLVPAGMMLTARIGWILAGASLLVLFLARRCWRPWGLVPMVIAAPVLRATNDWDAALASFLAIGITVLGVLAFGRRWWPLYLLLATVVALTLLLAADAYTAFGIALVVAWVAALAGYWFRAATRNRISFRT
jgi:hypothetical protein